MGMGQRSRWCQGSVAGPWGPGAQPAPCGRSPPPVLGKRGVLRLASSEPERVNAPDSSTNQTIWVFWGSFSLNACAAATVQFHKQLWKHPQQEVLQLEPQIPALGATEGPAPFFLLLLCSWVTTLPSPVWPKPEHPHPTCSPTARSWAPAPCAGSPQGWIQWPHSCCHIQSDGSAAIAVLTLATESTKPRGRYKVCTGRAGAGKGVRRGH